MLGPAAVGVKGHAKHFPSRIQLSVKLTDQHPGMKNGTFQITVRQPGSPKLCENVNNGYGLCWPNVSAEVFIGTHTVPIVPGKFELHDEGRVGVQTTYRLLQRHLLGNLFCVGKPAGHMLTSRER